MRMNLTARAIVPNGSHLSENSIVLTVRPAGHLPGEYSCATTSGSLRCMLRSTDLPSTIIERFEREIYSAKGSSLRAVELSETTLIEIGYFIE